MSKLIFFSQSEFNFHLAFTTQMRILEQFKTKQSLITANDISEFFPTWRINKMEGTTKDRMNNYYLNFQKA